MNLIFIYVDNRDSPLAVRSINSTSKSLMVCHVIRCIYRSHEELPANRSKNQITHGILSIT